LIGTTLFLAGIFIILIGFILIIIGISLGTPRDSESKQDYSKRESSFGKETDAQNIPDSEEPFYEKPPVRKIEPEIKTGGVIMIGPIPIIFGSDKESAKTVTILAIILMLLSLLIFRGSLF
jgi:uncharacterized protein (TIGR00304 family)